jgi:hypothetical protein
MNKNKYISFRVTESEYTLIKSKAEKAGMTISKFASKSILGQNIYVIKGVKDFTHQLSKIGTNVNQLAILAHDGKLKVIDLSETRKELNMIWQSLNLLRNHLKQKQD